MTFCHHRFPSISYSILLSILFEFCKEKMEDTPSEELKCVVERLFGGKTLSSSLILWLAGCSNQVW